MGVHDRGNIGSRPQNFGMDEDLAMARQGAADPLALAIDGDDVVGRHLLEADAGGLHQEAPVAIGQTQCHVPCDIIALVFAHEHAARLDEFFAQSIGHVATLFRALPLWPPAAIPTLHPTGHQHEAVMTQRSGPGTEQPRVEPEIIPPGDVRSRRAGASFDGTQRVYVARVGPFGFAMVALAIAALAMLLFLLVLGAFVILIPLAGLLLAVIIAVGLFRVLIWRRP